MTIIDARIRRFAEALAEAGWAEEVAAALYHIYYATPLDDEDLPNLGDPRIQFAIFTQHTIDAVFSKAKMFMSMHTMDTKVSALDTRQQPAQAQAQQRIAFLDDNQDPLFISSLEVLSNHREEANVLRTAFNELSQSISNAPELITSMGLIPGDLFIDGPQRGFTR
jgi:hypothetical protein